jgi:cytochrome c2
MKLYKAISHIASVLTIGAAMTIAVPDFSGPANAQEMESSIARGGRLYDKWYKVIKAETPSDTHPAWPASNEKKTGDVTHRCKSCHGWDLMGRDGAYASGSYLTGIVGLTAYAGASADAVVAIIKDDTHGFTGLMDDRDYADIANFVTMGQFDIDAAINRETKSANGDSAKGEAYYNTVCAGCHGLDGREPKDLPDSLGKLSNDNPWEIIHKIMNGQPAESMPAMRAFGPQVSTDILAFLQTLPLDK